MKKLISYSIVMVSILPCLALVNDGENPVTHDPNFWPNLFGMAYTLLCILFYTKTKIGNKLLANAGLEHSTNFNTMPEDENID